MYIASQDTHSSATSPASLSYHSCKRLTSGINGAHSLVSVVFDSTGSKLAVAVQDGRVLILVRVVCYVLCVLSGVDGYMQVPLLCPCMTSGR